MHLHSIQIGTPQTHHTPDPNAKRKSAAARKSGGDTDPATQPTWHSGIFKRAVEGPRFVGFTNLDGDRQADLNVHGGTDKAICVYAHEHYAYWQERLGLAEMPTGAFGENFTTLGLLESEVCIGDSYLFEGASTASGSGAAGVTGGLIVQLSQPRQPCWKLARRWQVADLVEQVQRSGYTGWYFRVLQEGTLQAGDRLRLLDRPYPQFTVSEANRVIHHDKQDWQAMAAQLACPLLSTSWRNGLRRRLNLHAPPP